MDFYDYEDLSEFYPLNSNERCIARTYYDYEGEYNPDA